MAKARTRDGGGGSFNIYDRSRFYLIYIPVYSLLMSFSASFLYMFFFFGTRTIGFGWDTKGPGYALHTALAGIVFRQGGGGGKNGIGVRFKRPPSAALERAGRRYDVLLWGIFSLLSGWEGLEKNIGQANTRCV